MRIEIRAFLGGCALLVATTGWAAKDRPIGVSPGNGSEITSVASRCPTFSWGPVRGARGHDLVIYTVGEEMSAATVAESAPWYRLQLPGTSSSWTPSLDKCLEVGRTYAWSVRAVGRKRVTDWSEPRLFRVAGRTASPDSPRAEKEPVEGVKDGLLAGNPVTAGSLQARDGREFDSAPPHDRPRVRELKRLIEGLRESGLESVFSLSPWVPAPAPPNGSGSPILGTASITVDQQIHLSATSGVFKEGELFLWGDAAHNTALGLEALSNNTTGGGNTATGHYALRYNTGGVGNTAVGKEALHANIDGSSNTGVGYGALASNTDGRNNTATGSLALVLNVGGYKNTAAGNMALAGNIDGSWNTATGYRALANNSSGNNNTATGAYALVSNAGGFNTANGFMALRRNETGYNNTAAGATALGNNTTGYRNVALGSLALLENKAGSANTAVGFGAMRDNTYAANSTSVGAWSLFRNTVGNGNTAFGQGALFYNTTGSSNIAVGYGAGFNLGYVDPPTGVSTYSYNIFVGNEGGASDEGTIRIGTEATHTRTYVAGIRGATTGLEDAIPVLIDSNGQLGTVSSSRRYKEDIESMGAVSERLLDLRPVTFRYKKPHEDGKKPIQFGLVAEEVAEVFPELVVYNEDGLPETVKYHLLSSLLLNELKKQSSELTELAALKERLAELEDVQARLARLEALETRPPQVAVVDDRARRSPVPGGR